MTYLRDGIFLCLTGPGIQTEGKSKPKADKQASMQETGEKNGLTREKVGLPVLYKPSMECTGLPQIRKDCQFY